MSRKEAVNLGFQQCRARGYECRLKDADRKGRDVWRVKFDAFTRGAKGHLHLDFDAYSHRLLRVDDKVRGHRNDHHHGRGKKKGHARWND